jgi:outer membrane scaffolding protein for murein synthesis (MipA/OmpV family)
MTKSTLIRAGLAVSGALLFAAPARAQEVIPVEIPQEVNMVGAGAFGLPDFPGAEDYHPEGAGFLHANFGNGMWLRVIGPEVRLNVLPSNMNMPETFAQLKSLRAGFLYRARPTRDTDVDDAIVRQMRRIPAASELGIFASYDMPMAGDPLHKIVFSGDVAWNTNNLYTGATGSVKATYFYPFPQGIAGRPVLGSAGFSLFFASDHFTDRYFGINGTDLAAFPERGGTPYRAEGGLVSIRVPFQLMSQFDRHWGVTLAGRYERLLGDAKDSPIVDRRGSPNQWVFGGSINYAF